MYQSFDAFEYVDYLRHRWRVIAAACGIALLLSAGVSLLLPKRYTATASIVIDKTAVGRNAGSRAIKLGREVNERGDSGIAVVFMVVDSSSQGIVAKIH